MADPDEIKKLRAMYPVKCKVQLAYYDAKVQEDVWWDGEVYRYESAGINIWGTMKIGKRGRLRGWGEVVPYEVVAQRVRLPPQQRMVFDHESDSEGAGSGGAERAAAGAPSTSSSSEGGGGGDGSKLVPRAGSGTSQSPGLATSGDKKMKQSTARGDEKKKKKARSPGDDRTGVSRPKSKEPSIGEAGVTSVAQRPAEETQQPRPRPQPFPPTAAPSSRLKKVLAPAVRAGLGQSASTVSVPSKASAAPPRPSASSMTSGKDKARPGPSNAAPSSSGLVGRRIKVWKKGKRGTTAGYKVFVESRRPKRGKRCYVVRDDEGDYELKNLEEVDYVTLKGGKGKHDGHGEGSGAPVEGEEEEVKLEELKPKDVVGRRIQVWWPSHETYFSGRLTGSDPVSGRLVLEYDDGQRELIFLDDEQFCWVSN